MTENKNKCKNCGTVCNHDDDSLYECRFCNASTDRYKTQLSRGKGNDGMSIIEKLGFSPLPWEADTILGSCDYEDPEKPVIIIDGVEWKPDKVDVPSSLQQIKDSKLMSKSPELFLIVYGMVDCAKKGEIGKAAQLLDLGEELIETIMEQGWEEVKETLLK